MTATVRSSRAATAASGCRRSARHPHRVRRPAPRSCPPRAVAQHRHRHRRRAGPAARRRRLPDDARPSRPRRRAARRPRRRGRPVVDAQALDFLDARSTPGPAGSTARGASCGAVAGDAHRAPTPTAAPPATSRRSSSRATRRPGSAVRQLHQLAGNDEQYAATLALAGQRLGIPSRVVMGASPRRAARSGATTCTPGSRCSSTTAPGCRPAAHFVPTATRSPSSSSRIRGAEDRRPGAAAGRGQPADGAPGARPGAERHPAEAADEEPARPEHLARLDPMRWLVLGVGQPRSSSSACSIAWACELAK